MRKKKLQGVGNIVILDVCDFPVAGEINFHSEAELELALKLSASIHDPEEKESFKKMMVEKKKADEHYSLFTDFPECDSELPAESNPTQANSSADLMPKPTPIKKKGGCGDFVGAAICLETIEMLKHGKKKEGA